ncbi:Manganese transport protein mntH1 [Salinisphaera shabanensis E1L3A]|uniref:Manganese transport protein mntH1 n=1 Tax=Salinisphaera shabanensis E1L3A TaxID=1033802 RepID=U2FRV8_9GAMM|nr:Nramp family divalent metal transporter [Salinisphaera shabanensis]ERJ18809.1 Manganese transport protein mntH1 [Salinisphaera shabanensis E1L3A]
MLQRLQQFGPGLLVAAAFIGPGTVTTASVAGAETGYALLWALVFSIFATLVLQEMSARLGIVARLGLGEALRQSFDSPLLRWAVIVLVVVAIGFGTAAFETGNITGAALGLETIAGLSTRVWALIVGAAALALLATGHYKLIERVLVALVLTMSVVFILTAIIVRPDIGAILAGIFTPSLPQGSVLTLIALVGTTVVTYNFFLHSAAVQDKWPRDVSTERALTESRLDSGLSIALGGLITLAIVITAAAAFFNSETAIEDAGQMASQLEPLLGPAAKWFFAIGLFAAGMTSSVTAPLAAAYAVSGALGVKPDLASHRFRAIWAAIIVIGMGFAWFGTKPVQAIVIAQAANGILLPLIAVFLLVVMNRRDLLGEHRNGLVGNLLGAFVVVVATGLGLYTLLSVFGVVSS